MLNLGNVNINLDDVSKIGEYQNNLEIRTNCIYLISNKVINKKEQERV